MGESVLGQTFRGSARESPGSPLQLVGGVKGLLSLEPCRLVLGPLRSSFFDPKVEAKESLWGGSSLVGLRQRRP